MGLGRDWLGHHTGQERPSAGLAGTEAHNVHAEKVGLRGRGLHEYLSLSGYMEIHGHVKL